VAEGGKIFFFFVLREILFTSMLTPHRMSSKGKKKSQKGISRSRTLRKRRNAPTIIRNIPKNENLCIEVIPG